MEKNRFAQLIARISSRKSSAVPRGTPRSSLLRLEALETRELLDAAPIAQSFSPEIAAEIQPLVDAPTPINLESATNWIVTTANDVNNSNDGVLSLREAIASANSGDTITFDSSLDNKTITLSGTELSIRKSLTIDASNLDSLTLDGGGKSRVLSITGGISTIDVNLIGLSIQNGKAADETYGGGISITKANVSLTASSVSNCITYGSGGSGIYCDSGSLTVDRCTISDNVAKSLTVIDEWYDEENDEWFQEEYWLGSLGGGILSYAPLVVTDSRIVSNEACMGEVEGCGVGGGIYCASTAVFTNCEIKSNLSDEVGAGVYAVNGATFTNCTITGNTTFYEYAIVSEKGDLVVMNSLICENSEGGIYYYSGTATITNSAFYSNSSMDLDFYKSNALSIYNSIIALNKNDSLYDCNLTQNVTIANTLSAVKLAGTSNIAYNSSKPLFQNASGGDFTLAQNSQAVDKGNNSYISVSADLAGNARIRNDIVDLGPYELQQGTCSELTQLATPTIVSTDATSDSITLSWTPIEHAAQYLLKYKKGTETEFTSVTVPSNVSSYALEGLNAETTYKLQVQALGDGVAYSDSAESAVITATTDGAPSLVVTTNADVVNPNDGVLSLREAIAAAQDGDTITFDSSMNYKIVELDGSELSITKSLTIDASNLVLITISGRDKSRVFNIDGGSTTIDVKLVDLRIVGGVAEKAANGGGLYIANSNVTLERCVVEFNETTGGCGAGIYCASGSLTTDSCTIKDNYAWSYYEEYYDEETEEYWEDEICGQGGGVYTNAPFYATDTSFKSNLVEGYDAGGGLYHNDKAVLIGCSFISNETYDDYGCGIYSDRGGDLQVYGSVFYDNHYYYDSSATICNSIYVESGATARIEHVTDLDGITNEGSLKIVRSIIVSVDNYMIYEEVDSLIGVNPGFVTPLIWNGDELEDCANIDLHVRADSPYASEFQGGQYVGVFSTLGAGTTVDYSIVTTSDDVVSATDGLVSLREALAYAPSTETITFSNDVSNDVLLEKSLKIWAKSSINGGGRVTLTHSGTKKDRLIVVGRRIETNLSNLSLTGGEPMYRYDDGGAILNTGSLSIENALFYNNKGYFGGAIRSHNGDLSLQNARFYNNNADYGGAIYSYNGDLSLQNVVARNNTANYGGAINISSCRATIINCEITGNIATNTGGGIRVGYSSVTDIYNSVIASNQNEGLNVYGVYAGTVSLYNSIVVNNEGNDIAKSAGKINGYHTLSSYTDWTESANTYVYDETLPLFTDATNGDYTLANGSQALNKGNNTWATTETDLAGNPRVSQEIVDLGPYEAQGVGQLPTPTLSTTVEGTSIVVSWNPEPNATKYYLKYKNANDSAFTTVTVAKSVSSYTLADLTPGATYQFKLQAVGDKVNYLNSEYSDLVSATVEGATQLPTPTLATTVEGTSIVVSWNTEPNATKYFLKYKNANDSAFATVSVAKSVSSYTLADLTPGATYQFKLQAVGDKVNYLNSEYSDLVSATVEGATQLPTPTLATTVEGTSIVVSWNTEPNATKYYLKYKNANDSAFATVSVAKSAASYTLNDLTPGATYQFKLQAVGDKVNYLSSEYSELVSATIHANQLDAPTLTIASKKPTSFIVKWDAVEGATGYVFEYKGINATSYESVTLAASKTQRQVANLVEGVQYNVRVRALGNAQVADSEYAEILATTQQTLASPDVTLKKATQDSLSFEWSLIEGAVGYAVMYKGADDAAYTKLTLDATPGFTLQGLQMETSYSVKVSAIGDGFDYKSSAYSTLTAYRTTNPFKLVPPTLTATDASNDSILLHWDAVPNATKVYVAFAPVGSTSFTTVSTSGTKSYYQIQGLAPNTEYQVKLRAVNSSSEYVNSKYSAISSISTTQTPFVSSPLNVPNVTATVSGANSIFVEWNADPRALGYAVIYKAKSDSEYTIVNLAASESSLNLTDLQAETTYYVKARALGDGAYWTNSAYCGTKVVATPSAESAALLDDVFAELLEDELEF